MATQQRVNPQQDGRASDQGDTTTGVSLGMIPGEIEVGAVQHTAPPQVEGVVIRVNRDIEDMTYSGGDLPFFRATFNPGRRYRVPVQIATELERIGALWH